MGEDVEELREIFDVESREVPAADIKGHTGQVAWRHLAQAAPGRKEHEGEPERIQSDA